MCTLTLARATASCNSSDNCIPFANRIQFEEQYLPIPLHFTLLFASPAMASPASAPPAMPMVKMLLQVPPSTRHARAARDASLCHRAAAISSATATTAAAPRTACRRCCSPCIPRYLWCRCRISLREHAERWAVCVIGVLLAGKCVSGVCWLS